MARTTTITCDKCGSEGGDCWYEQVTPIRTFSPEDGVNGGVIEKDLCSSCRRRLNVLILDFFYPPPKETNGHNDQRVEKAGAEGGRVPSSIEGFRDSGVDDKAKAGQGPSE